MTRPPLRRASYFLHVTYAAHHDREGASPFPVARLELISLLDQVIDLFETDPRFQHFTLDQNILLEDYLALRPENFERIEQAVQQGRLVLGPWYIQTEPLLVSQESIIRNLLLGLRTARVFGRPILIGYLPEAVGLSDQMPQIFKSFGIHTAIIGPIPRLDQPTELRWRGRDGTEILVGYQRELQWQDQLTARRNRLAPYTDSGQLLLLSALDMKHLDTLSTVQRELHDEVFQSHPATYAHAIESYARSHSIPTVSGKDAFGNPSAVANWQKLTMQNTAFECLLTQWVEPLAVWSEYLETNTAEANRSFRRPHALIQKLWRTLLENQSRSLLRGKADSATYADAVEYRYWTIQRIAHSLYPSLQGKTYRPTESFFGNLIDSSESGFELTTVKLPEEADRDGMIVRGENPTDERLWVTLTPWRTFAVTEVVTMDEAPTGGKLAADSNGAIRFQAGPHRILTFWFHD